MIVTFIYCKWGKFHRPKLSWYSHYPGNTFTVQGLVAYMLYILRAKDAWEKLSRSSKIPQKFSPVKLIPSMVAGTNYLSQMLF